MFEARWREGKKMREEKPEEGERNEGGQLDVN